eukprot:3090575-Alexandrium_andersonii.AAC.1
MRTSRTCAGHRALPVLPMRVCVCPRQRRNTTDGTLAPASGESPGSVSGAGGCIVRVVALHRHLWGH